MAVSLNSVVCFNSRETNFDKLSRSSIEASLGRISQITYLRTAWSRRVSEKRRHGLCLSIKSSNQLDSDIDDKSSTNEETSLLSENELGVKSSNESSSSLDQKLGTSSAKKSPLTAKERLRAARVLGRYTESKSTKPEMGAKVLDALRDSDGGKRRSGLPEAPTNMLDDSKRGMPKPGLTFDFPGGFDLFVIIFSFVFISTVMFATTYIVWKAGAIHFNEY